MHYSNYTAGVPTPAVTYAPKLWRSLEADVFWSNIETSDNVFDWALLDEVIPYMAAQGQDIYYQVYATPNLASHRLVDNTWKTVPDQDGKIGAGCVPQPVKLARFVTALLTRYPQIKYISPWNEPKWSNPVLKFGGSVTAGAVNVGDSVTGVTSRAVGTVTANTGTILTVQLHGPAYSVTAFGNSEQIRVNDSASNVFTATTQNAVHYFHGTKEQLVSTAQTVYNAAKAVRSDIIVTTPDFTDGANISGQEEWLSSFLDSGGNAYVDALAYHFYNFDIRPATVLGTAYSIQQRCDDLDSILLVRGMSKIPKIASEVGYTPGWGFWNMTTDRVGQGKTLQRVAGYLAARGWKAAIFFDHENEYAGDPAANAEVANALRNIGLLLTGKIISGAYIGPDNTLRMLVNGQPLIL
jgi:hypothetical protein